MNSNSAVVRLQSLRVSDVMTEVVVQVSARQTMNEAAQIMRRHGVTVAPVVDEEGRCIGVISATDFLRRDGAGPEARLREGGDYQPREGGHADNEVSRHMTHNVQSVQGDALMMTAARTMYVEHLHRLLVLDRMGRPRGIISTMDVISALINSLEEMEHSAEPAS